MNIKAFFAMPLAFLMMLVSLVFPPKTPAGNSIAEIYVRTAAAVRPPIHEYKFDLASQNFWTYVCPDLPGQDRDEDAPFEGFTFAGRLSKLRIAAFLAAAEVNDFSAWEGDYPPTYPTSGNLAWRITIVFADGTTRVSSGSSPDGYPAHWAEMCAAFNALAGRVIIR